MIDLHTHSTVSDGSDPPGAIAELAAAAGCSAVALTDHDRVDGIAPAAARAAELGIELVPGCEVSCEWSPGTCHVLVYFVQDLDSPLGAELLRLQEDRATRNQRLLARLGELGIDLSIEEVAAKAGGGSIGRPHFAAVLVDRGVVADSQEAFDTLLGKGKAAYVSKARIHADEVAHLARRSGGVAVLAHPLSLGLDPAGTAAAVGELAEAGLGGIEAMYGRYSADERAGLARLAAEKGLVATGGSDHHGTFKPDLSVGVGTGDLDVPDGVLEELRSRRP